MNPIQLLVTISPRQLRVLLIEFLLLSYFLIIVLLLGDRSKILANKCGIYVLVWRICDNVFLGVVFTSFSFNLGKFKQIWIIKLVCVLRIQAVLVVSDDLAIKRFVNVLQFRILVLVFNLGQVAINELVSDFKLV